MADMRQREPSHLGVIQGAVLHVFERHLHPKSRHLQTYICEPPLIHRATVTAAAAASPSGSEHKMTHDSRPARISTRLDASERKFAYRGVVIRVECGAKRRCERCKRKLTCRWSPVPRKVHSSVLASAA